MNTQTEIKPMQFRNWKGEMMDAPKDLRQVVATYDNDTIVWSRSGKRHQVRYALEVTPCGTSLTAAEQFGYCVHHLEECNGKL
jgi:hypothetical protein